MEPVRAGWYPDPMNVGASRYWNGSAWSQHVVWGDRQIVDPTPIHQVDERAVQHHADVVRAYLADAEARGTIDRMTAAILRSDLEGLAARRALEGPIPHAPATPGMAPTHLPPPVREPAPAPERPPIDPLLASPPVHAPVAPSETPAPARVQPPATRPGPPRTTTPEAPPPLERRPEPVRRPIPRPVQRQPGRVAVWWARTRETVSSDLAIHWLAYLGVLLMFAGVVGFLVFSSQDVTPGLRSVAEAAAPMSIFLGAWFLRRRRAVWVAAALTLLGGAVLPVVVIASLTDGSAPDVTGKALPLTASAACAVIALTMALVVRRSPTSPLRFVAAPILWLGVGVLLAVTRNPVPTGEGVARPNADQIAAIIAAITATVLALRLARVKGALAKATDLIAAPIAIAMLVVEALLAGSHGWPVTSGVVGAGCAVLLFELLADRLPKTLVVIGQAAAVCVVALRLLPEVDGPWAFAGLALALLALIEYSGRRRPTEYGLAVSAILAVAAGSLTIAGDSPVPALVTFGAACLWTLWRRAVPPKWLRFRDPFGSVPAAVFAVVTIEFWRLAGAPTAVVTIGGVAAGVGLIGRVARRVGADALWRWFVPAMAVAAALAVLAIHWGESPVPCATAVALAAVAFAVCAIPVGPRTWLSAGTAVWSLVFVAKAFETTRGIQGIVLASVAAGLVCLAIFDDHAASHHLGFVGHLAGVAALGVPREQDWPVCAILVVASAAWLFTAVVHEGRGARHIAWLIDSVTGPSGKRWDWFSNVPAVCATVGASASAMVMFDTSGAVPVDNAWSPMAVGAVAVIVMCLVRVVRWRRASRRVLMWVSGAAALGTFIAAALLAEPEGPRWPVIAALGIGIGVAVLAPAPRPALFTGMGWALSAPLAVLLVEELGLGRRWLDVATAGWGAVVCIGGLAVDRRRRVAVKAGRTVRSPNVFAPVLLGTLGFVGGGVLSLVDETRPVSGWLCLAYAVPMLAAAFLLPLGVLSGGAEMLVTAGLMLVLPWKPLEHPWSIVPWAAALVGVAWLTRPRMPTRWALRWDMPASVVALGSAAMALGAAVQYDSVSVTWAPVAGLCIVVAVLWRTSWWAALGAAILLVAAGSAGHGWFALALLGEGLVSTGGGLRMHKPLRVPVIVLGAGLLSGAWAEFVYALGWSPQQATVVTVSVGSGLLLGSAVGLRVRFVPRDLSLVWLVTSTVWLVGAFVLAMDPDVGRRAGGLASAGALVAVAVAGAVVAPVLGRWTYWLSAAALSGAWAEFAYALGWSPQQATVVTVSVGSGLLLGSAVGLRVRFVPRDLSLVWLVTSTVWLVGAFVLAMDPDVGRRAGGLASAGALVAVAVAGAVVAPVLGRWTYWLSAAALSGAWAEFAYALGVHATAVSLISTGAALVLAMLALTLWTVRPGSAWIAPLLLAVGLTQLFGGAAGFSLWSERGPITTALLAAAVEVAVFGTVVRRLETLVASPVLACTAWIVWASHAWNGDPNWFTLPVGLTVLVMTGMLRWIRRERGGKVTGQDIAVLEFIGMGAIVGPPIVLVIAGHLWYSLVAIVCSFLLAAWGAVTRVRRRTLFGAAATVLAVVVVVAVPLVREVPTWRGAALWLALAGMGALAIVVAAFFEQGRASVRRLRLVVEEITKEWERTGGPEASHGSVTQKHTEEKREPPQLLPPPRA